MVSKFKCWISPYFALSSFSQQIDVNIDNFCWEKWLKSVTCKWKHVCNCCYTTVINISLHSFYHKCFYLFYLFKASCIRYKQCYRKQMNNIRQTIFIHSGLHHAETKSVFFKAKTEVTWHPSSKFTGNIFFWNTKCIYICN